MMKPPIETPWNRIEAYRPRLSSGFWQRSDRRKGPRISRPLTREEREGRRHRRIEIAAAIAGLVVGVIIAAG